MTPGPFTIWSNAKFNPAALEVLRRRTAKHRLILSPNAMVTNLQPSDHESAAEAAQIILGQPSTETVIASNHMRWIHLTSAGYTRYDNAEIRNAMKSKHAVMTNSSAVYEEPCAEHLLAFMLSNARNLPPALAAQATDRSWNTRAIRDGCRLLVGQSAVILGFGTIARRVAELLTPFRMNLSAVRRTPSGREPIPTFPVDQLDRLLPDADHVINILPAGEETRQLVDAKKLSLMKRGAIFYNIGRGDTVDQNALTRALESKQLGAAYLDVTSPEPLPPDHPLWRAPNCHITPHTAGGRDDEMHALVEHFLENLARFERDEPMHDQIIS